MTCTDPTKDEASLLLSRLQSQFGDLDISAFLSDALQTASGGDDDESESSFEEPSPEELRAWQESQFQKGRMKLDAQRFIEEADKGDVHKINLQRRRKIAQSAAERLLKEAETEDEEWEKVVEWEEVGFPQLNESSIFFPSGKTGSGPSLHPLLHELAAADPEALNGPWHNLFSSSRDGLSFASLLDRIRGYKGPTVMLFGGYPSPDKCLNSNDADIVRSNTARDDGEEVALGFFTTDYWIESPEFFGTDDCFLFSLDHDKNEVQIVRPKSRDGSASTVNQREKKTMYCNPSTSRSSNIKTNGTVHGICIGASSTAPRLHLTESLEHCRSLPYDSSFSHGDLLLSKCNDSLYYFNVDSLEVWGVGGRFWIETALRQQRAEREVRERALEKTRKVDKRMLLEHFENGVVIGEAKGLFGHWDLVEERDVNCRIGEDSTV
jgi:hypothetical protein